MKEDTKKMVRAFIEVYKEFEEELNEYCKENRDLYHHEEVAMLFQTAWNDSFLGEVLKEEVLERYRQLMHAEQVKREIEEEAEAGEAMII